MTKNRNICPVCGYDKLLEPPYDQHQYPTYEICGCCGFEYGVDDGDKGYTFKAYREKWIKEGFPFNSPDEKPKEWDEEMMRKQLENTKKVDYKPRIL